MHFGRSSFIVSVAGFRVLVSPVKGGSQANLAIRLVSSLSDVVSSTQSPCLPLGTKSSSQNTNNAAIANKSVSHSKGTTSFCLSHGVLSSDSSLMIIEKEDIACPSYFYNIIFINNN